MMNKNDSRIIDNSTLDYKAEDDSSGDNYLLFKAVVTVTLLLAGSIISFGLNVSTIVLLLADIFLFFIITGATVERVKYKKRTAKDKLDVVGLADDSELNNLDLNSDGHVDLYEYYTKTEDEIEEIIKSKCHEFSKNEFYEYIKKSILIIEDGIRLGDYKAFSGYLNYSYYKRLKNKIKTRNNNDDVLNKIVGVVLKDCVVLENIMTVKVAITLNYKSRNKNEVYILTYINNLNDRISDNNCFNCGAPLNKGICDYCDTYNYFSYKGFILSDKVAIRISGD